ncbi:hypothetical protein [Legionella brunensis]|uniref:Phasin domain-containing protein n=1 Tax=Legionella brunensis TaxID=29422 RepID=A0A0W0S135_9GAMM|nr:hypothetical protein [Legionella brunensis]KTC77104.1 hypothetical protein Lbru_3211 [Legionella brunensis]
MNQDYFKSWAALVTEMHKPFQAMMELNIRTLQNLHYLRPEESSNWRQPNKLMDNQMKLVMENSHQMLDYMRQSFQILENAFSFVSKEMQKNSEQVMGRATSMSASNVSPVKAKTSSSSPKKTTAKSKKTSMSSSKKPVSAKMATQKNAGTQAKKTMPKAAKGTSTTVKASKPAPKKMAKSSTTSKGKVVKTVKKPGIPSKVAKTASTPASKPSMGTITPKVIQNKMMPESKVAMPATKMTMPATKITMPESKHHIPSNVNPANMFRHGDKMPEPKK